MWEGRIERRLDYWEGGCDCVPWKAIPADRRTCLYAARAIRVSRLLDKQRSSCQQRWHKHMGISARTKTFTPKLTRAKSKSLTPTSSIEDVLVEHQAILTPSDPMSTVQVSLPLPVLPQDWAGDNDFKVVGQLSPATQRNLEPVGPHFLAHARRVRRIQAPNRRVTS